MTASQGEHGLQRNAIGLTETLFQSITHMAPAVATALSIGAATLFAGGVTPLAVVFALVACLFTAYSIGELSRHLPSAGGMYTYVGRGLGKFFGWMMAWAFALAEPLVPPALFASFGLFGAALVTNLTGFEAPWLWIALAVACAAIVWWLVYRGVKLSADAGVILGVIEIAIFVVIAGLLIINAGDRNTLAVFIPADGNYVPALQGMVFTLLAFVGFEAAAPLGEEAKNPKVTIRRAVILSTIVIGAFYIFNYYAATVFFGPDRMAADFYAFNNGDPWGAMAEDVLPGIGSLLITFAILNSSIANANSGATASTRSVFAMGRAGLLPRWFAAIHPVHRTPGNAINAQTLGGIAVVVGLGLWLENNPLNVYIFIGYSLGLLFALLYITVNAAAIGYYWRERRSEFNVIKHLVVPVLGMLAMVPAFLSVLGGVNVFGVELPPLSGFLVYVPPLVFGWLIIGVVIYAWLRANRPEALARVGEVMGES